MTLDIQQYDERPARIEAVKITEENLGEVATWMGCDSYTITRNEGSDRIIVEFISPRLGRDRHVHLSPNNSDIYAVKNRDGRFTLMYVEEIKKLWKKVK